MVPASAQGHDPQNVDSPTLAKNMHVITVRMFVKRCKLYQHSLSYQYFVRSFFSGSIKQYITVWLSAARRDVLATPCVETHWTRVVKINLSLKV